MIRRLIVVNLIKIEGRGSGYCSNLSWRRMNPTVRVRRHVGGITGRVSRARVVNLHNPERRGAKHWNAFILRVHRENAMGDRYLVLPPWSGRRVHPLRRQQRLDSSLSDPP
jgi:hypothetical protein